MQKHIPVIVCIVLALFFLVSCQKQEESGQHTVLEKGEIVILLHGLSRSDRSMREMEKNLSRKGYHVINIDYPSAKHTIQFIADEMLSTVIERNGNTPPLKIHFVTHSMGGIVIRYYLKNNSLSNLGRVVMISPPNQGTELVDYLNNSRIFGKFNTPAGRQLGTGKNSLPLSLGPVDFELGVIAGNRSFNPLYSWILPGPDDGVVSVERTKVAGMKDFIVLPYSHTFIMHRDDVIKQVIHFLEHGAFMRKGS